MSCMKMHGRNPMVLKILILILLLKNINVKNSNSTQGCTDLIP